MDLRALPTTLLQSISTLGGKKITNFIDCVMSQMEHFEGFFPTDDSKKSFRRLSYFADKEDKSRVIAIGDYFSQTVLRRFHLYLFRVLRRIPQDVTFDQGRFKEMVKDWDIYYSVDLKSATDRFPIDLISKVLECHFPANYISA